MNRLSIIGASLLVALAATISHVSTAGGSAGQAAVSLAVEAMKPPLPPGTAPQSLP